MQMIIDELELVPVKLEELEVKEEPSYILKAQAAGFTNVRLNSKPRGISSLPYPEITPKAITNLLKKRALEVFNREMSKERSDTLNLWLSLPSVQWVEHPIAKYTGYPPAHILTSIERARQTGIFKDFYIVTVEEVPDPLLIGKTEDGRRGLIDHWGKDLTSEEIMSLVD